MIVRVEELSSKKLSEIARYCDLDSSSTEVNVTGIVSQAQSVIAGDLFLGLAGTNTHGAKFAELAITNGAVAILTDAEGASIISDSAVPVLVISNPRLIAGNLTAWFYGFPLNSIFAIGITGTNGKTTTTTLLHQLWQSANIESALIGTIATQIGSEILPSKRTTPESDELQALFAVMRERQIRNLAMEVSSHALSQNRVTGSKFKAVAFTNLTQDHLDFHGSMDRYYQAKKSLFTFEYAEKGFINIDGDFGNQLVNDSEIPIATISKYNHKANWYYEAAIPTSSGYEVSIRGIGGVLISGKLPLFGEYNLENAIMAIALAVESGLDPIFVGTQMQAMKGASGRLEPINLGQSFAAFVDYAHSPDSVTRVLETAKAFTAGKVIAVLGCGGDRDVTKRPLMGAALSNGSDIAIFTSDNPRSEAPQVILDSMTAGLKVSAPSKVIENRSSAIEYAVSLAKPGDTVLLLGKGHEIGQEIAGVIHSFDDRIELARVIEGKS